MPSRSRIAALCLLWTLAGCVKDPDLAPKSSALATAADAPGFLILGLADDAAVYRLFRVTNKLEVEFHRDGGGTAFMQRHSPCDLLAGCTSADSDTLSELGRQVLRVRPGAWTMAAATEQTSVFGAIIVLHSTFLLQPVTIRPGEVVYIGDFTFHAEQDVPRLDIVRHGRDDAAAGQALAAYPGLRAAPIQYREPILTPAVLPPTPRRG